LPTTSGHLPVRTSNRIKALMSDLPGFKNPPESEFLAPRFSVGGWPFAKLGNHFAVLKNCSKPLFR